MGMRVKELLNMGEKQLLDSGIPDAARDSKSIYCYMMNIPTSRLVLEYQESLQDYLCERYFGLIDRRAAGEPVQYIAGCQEFMGLKFKVDPRVLIPRLDTEVLAEDALSLIQRGVLRREQLVSPLKSGDVLDLCCGSGCLGITIAHACPKINVTCADLSQDALAVAAENVALNGVGKRVKLVQGDMLQPFRGRFRHTQFDMIICNPPYIRTEEIATLQKEVREHEPMGALDGGADGLDFYRVIAKDAPTHLKKGGILMLEIGYDQKSDVIDLLQRPRCFSDIRCLPDLTGKDRVIYAR